MRVNGVRARAACRVLAVAGFAVVAGLLGGWGAHGHRTITRLALDALPADAPTLAWLREPAARERVAEQSNEPDRWRGTQALALQHENNPDHYLDVDLLPEFGLTLETVPPLRYDYLRAMAVAKHVHPEMAGPYDRRTNPDGSQEWPGFVLHAMSEHYQKLRSSFNTLRILESLNDPARAGQLALARQNVEHEMGILSHFVGDTAQPLHTTKHHHGWVGDNPKGYSTDRRIHAYIDSQILRLHGLEYDGLRPGLKLDVAVNAADPWEDQVKYLGRSHATVELLYQMEKNGTLTGPEGKAFISERLLDAGGMLGAMYKAAWEASAPTEREISAFVKFSSRDEGSAPLPPRGGAVEAPAGASPAANPEPKP